MTSIRSALEPGDRRIRAVLRPELPTTTLAVPDWSCSRCGASCTGVGPWAVLHGPFDAAVPYASMVCVGCAAALTPFRLVVDLAGVRASSGDATGRVVADHVEDVLAMRRSLPGDAVRLRAMDTQELARCLDTTRTDLALRLQELGALRGVDLANEPLDGPAREPGGPAGGLAPTGT